MHTRDNVQPLLSDEPPVAGVQRRGHRVGNNRRIVCPSRERETAALGRASLLRERFESVGAFGDLNAVISAAGAADRPTPTHAARRTAGGAGVSQLVAYADTGHCTLQAHHEDSAARLLRSTAGFRLTCPEAAG